MSLTIKVLLDQKLYRLTPEVQTLEQVNQEMRQRFPSVPRLTYFYEDIQVFHLLPFICKHRAQGLKSLKLTAKASDSTIIQRKTQLSISSIIEPQSNSESCISLLGQKHLEELPSTQMDLPSQFYVCYNCLGKGETIESSDMHLCSICKGRGRLDDQHRYVLRIKALYRLHIASTHKSEAMLEDSNQRPIRKNSRIDRNYSVVISEISKMEKVQIGKLFTMKFQIKNVGKDWNQQNIQFIECGLDNGQRVSQLKGGEKTVIEVGPFICSNDGTFEKTYSLYYKSGEQLVRFGHRFGFSVKGIKKNEVKPNIAIDIQRQRIRDLKMLSGSLKSEQYLSLKLKSMEIDLLNLEIDDEGIIDIIQQIN